MSLVGIYALRVSLCTRFVKGDQLGSSSSIFLLNFIMKKKMPSIRVVQLLYTIVYILLYFYTCKTNFVFFFFSSTQVSCFVVTVPWLADRYFQEEVNGGADNRWTVTTHPPPAANLAALTGVTIVLLCLSIPLPGVCVQLSSYARPTTEGDPRLSWLKYPN